MSLTAAINQTIIGFLEAFAVLVIIFGAILIMNTLSASGAMAAINRMFTGISPDARIPVSYTHLDVYKRQRLGGSY